MIHRPSEIGVREGDATEWRTAQCFARRGLSFFAEEKAGLRIAVRMSPAIENNSSDVSLCVESG